LHHPCCNDLCAILICFRLHQFGISTIEKVFLHIRLHLDDRNLNRFFWITDPTDPFSKFWVYRFKVVPSGAASLPFILNTVLQHHLKQHTLAVSHEILTSGVGHPVVESSRLLQCRRTHLTIVNILGFHWNPKEDRISLAEKPSILTNEPLITKRELLQDLSRMFDSLGLIAPILIQGKILMQKLWQLRGDEPLHDDLLYLPNGRTSLLILRTLLLFQGVDVTLTLV